MSLIPRPISVEYIDPGDYEGPQPQPFAIVGIEPSGGGIASVVAGDNVTIDDSDPKNPVISSAGGGGGDVSSVNGKTGTVVLAASDVGALPSTYEPPAPAWADVTGKPTTFTPAAHTQAISTITGLQGALDAKAATADLGTAAAADVTDFATAAQGATADSAVQPAAVSTLRSEIVALVIESSGTYPTPPSGYAAYRYVGTTDPESQSPALPIPDGSEWVEVID